MKTLTVVLGIAGSGKSSFIGALRDISDDFNLVINNTTETHIKSSDNTSNSYLTIKDEIEKCINNELTFAVEMSIDSNNIDIIRFAKQKGYYVRVYYIGLGSLDECLLRVSKRAEKAGESVDLKIVEHQYKMRFDNLIAALPYCDQVKFFDNENGFACIAEYENSELKYTESTQPEWYKLFENFLKIRKTMID